MRGTVLANPDACGTVRDMYVGLRHILARDVDERHVAWVARVTSLKATTVSARLARAAPTASLAEVFAAQWPDDPDTLRHLTVAVARDAGLESEIAAQTGLSHPQIRRRLLAANGATRLGKVFPALAGGEDEDVERDFPLPLGEARVQAVRDTPLVDWLSERTGWTKAKVRRRLDDAHGATYVRNALADVWPVDEGDEWDVRAMLGTLPVGVVRASEAVLAWVAEHTREPASWMDVSDAEDDQTVEEVLGSLWPMRPSKTASVLPKPHTVTRGSELVNDRWRLEEELGTGGFGTAWLATDTRIDERVVLKFSRGSDGVDFLKRELKLAWNLNHPNICAYRDIGLCPNRGTFIVSQFGGEALDKVMRRKGPLPPEAAIQVVRQVAAALDHAHQREVLHLDVKPQNVVIEIVGRKESRVRLVDFGIASVLRDTVRLDGNTRVGEAVGYSPGYAAPEQRDLEPRPASDQYSLAVTFCSLLLGEIFVSRYRHRRITGLSAGANAAVVRALSEDHRQRFRTCAEFVRALEGS